MLIDLVVLKKTFHGPYPTFLVPAARKD